MQENYNDFFQNEPIQEQLIRRPWGCPPCPPCRCPRDRWDNRRDDRPGRPGRNDNWPWR